jgi:single-stranded-DNA-specific exonuclease
LRRGLAAFYDQTMPAAEGPVRSQLAAELQLRDLAGIDNRLLNHLELLEPHGNGNPQPIVGLEGLRVQALRRVGADRRHVSLRLADTQGAILSAIGFGLAERHATLQEGTTVSLKGTLNNNEFQGRSSVQIVLSEIIYE